MPIKSLSKRINEKENNIEIVSILSMNYVTSKEITGCGLLPVLGGNSLVSLTVRNTFSYLDTLQLAAGWFMALQLGLSIHQLLSLIDNCFTLSILISSSELDPIFLTFTFPLPSSSSPTIIAYFAPSLSAFLS